MKKVLEVHENRRLHLSTSALNKVIQQAITQTPPPVTKGKLIKIKYVTQLPLPSPTFALFANLPQYIPTAYKRYLEKQLRAQFNFEGAPITLVFKRK